MLTALHSQARDSFRRAALLGISHLATFTFCQIGLLGSSMVLAQTPCARNDVCAYDFLYETSVGGVTTYFYEGYYCTPTKHTKDYGVMALETQPVKPPCSDCGPDNPCCNPEMLIDPKVNAQKKGIDNKAILHADSPVETPPAADDVEGIRQQKHDRKHTRYGRYKAAIAKRFKPIPKDSVMLNNLQPGVTLDPDYGTNGSQILKFDTNRYAQVYLLKAVDMKGPDNQYPPSSYWVGFGFELDGPAAGAIDANSIEAHLFKAGEYNYYVLKQSDPKVNNTYLFFHVLADPNK